jgi:hypothetical protein
MRAFTSIHRKRQSSLGQLDSIPLELLHECLAYLDIVSLQRLFRVSLHGNLVAGSLPLLKKLAQATRNALDVLSKARLLGLHSINTLYAALQSDRCISCGSYGPFLLLLPAQRCCYPRLVVNHRYG